MVRMAIPSWVGHEGQTIFSLDVHPDGTRFATAGHDGKIKIWSMKPVVDEEAEADETVPRTLATLSAHEGSVNCVRWSPNGRLLASGSDDQVVMLWRLALPGERVAMPFGSGAAPNVEKWRCVARLQGHDGDVVDVAWAPDSRRLASVSLDNTVRVWDTSADRDVVTLLKVLEGHMGMVKGVAWDPIGRYIASQGDDRAVILWDTREWSQANKVERPFERTSQKTLFRRLSWSHDGQILCCPHAYKKPVHIAVAFDRPVSRAPPKAPSTSPRLRRANCTEMPPCLVSASRLLRRPLPNGLYSKRTSTLSATKPRSTARPSIRTRSARPPRRRPARPGTPARPEASQVRRTDCWRLGVRMDG